MKIQELRKKQESVKDTISETQQLKAAKQQMTHQSKELYETLQAEFQGNGLLGKKNIDRFYIGKLFKKYKKNYFYFSQFFLIFFSIIKLFMVVIETDEELLEAEKRFHKDLQDLEKKQHTLAERIQSLSIEKSQLEKKIQNFTVEHSQLQSKIQVSYTFPGNFSKNINMIFKQQVELSEERDKQIVSFTKRYLISGFEEGPFTNDQSNQLLSRTKSMLQQLKEKITQIKVTPWDNCYKIENSIKNKK